MIFNEHRDLKDKHSFLSPSKYHWLRYDVPRLLEAYENFRAAERGTELHAFAKRAIELGVKLARSKSTLSLYVNDAIGYRMTPEVTLKYSDFCFGTADAICYRKESYPELKRKIPTLRIHDLKTGKTPASMDQILVYDAIFCLEYSLNPYDIMHELRIYQNDSCLIHRPTGDEVREVCDKIIEFDKILVDQYGRMGQFGKR